MPTLSPSDGNTLAVTVAEGAMVRNDEVNFARACAPASSTSAVTRYVVAYASDCVDCHVVRDDMRRPATGAPSAPTTRILASRPAAARTTTGRSGAKSVVPLVGAMCTAAASASARAASLRDSTATDAPSARAFGPARVATPNVAAAIRQPMATSAVTSPPRDK